MSIKRRIYIYDSTLRDGAQTAGVDFSLQNKIDIANLLDSLSIDYIEAGWPGANPLDTSFFQNLPKLKRSKFTGFGMTRRANMHAIDDVNLGSFIGTNVSAVTLVGKSWDFHVKTALGVTLQENLEMISDSIKFLISQQIEVFFDAEHFFDGYKANPEYALEVVETAYKAGARFVILCDTNGGTLPHEISMSVTEIAKKIPGDNLGIHCHNDTGNAIANTLSAVRAGVSQVQGTLNGLGERCGNADLVALIPIFVFKLGYDVGIAPDSLTKLKHASNYLQDILNQNYNSYAPFVGSAAFSHKGGLHASAIVKNTELYEHINPELVGNTRNILVSDQAGRASIMSRLSELKIKFDKSDPRIMDLITLVKAKEAKGYSYDSANASFALLAFRAFKKVPEFFKLEYYKIIDEKRINAKDELTTVSSSVIKLYIAGSAVLNVAEGNGPVNALDNAFRKSLINFYPEISATKLSDYKVRILNSDAATQALIRVLIETSDERGNRWVSVGVSTDLIDATFQALKDSYIYQLLINSLSNNDNV